MGPCAGVRRPVSSSAELLREVRGDAADLARFRPSGVDVQALVTAVVEGFPVAALLGWSYDIVETGLRRTRPADAHGSERP